MSLSAPEFDFVCDLVRRESAIVLESGKEYLAESRLQTVARRHGLSSASELVRQIRRGSMGGLELEVVDAMTTNETSFFRDAHPWESLRADLLPELFRTRRLAGTINIWCGACSSGQEPYSLAMLLQEHFRAEMDNVKVRILATDLSGTMLERCRLGRYSQLEMNRGLPAPMLVRYFDRQGMEWELRPDVRAMVETSAVNLAEPGSWAGLPQFDLILLRNVLIYFDVETKRDILRRVHSQLRPNGPLILGSAETTIGLIDYFAKDQSGKTIFYRAI